MRSDTFRDRVNAQPGNLLFRFSLGQALFQEGRPADALPHLELCAAGRADWLLPRLLLGQACLQLSRPDDARRWLREALDLAIAQNHDDPAADCRRLLAELD
ncbi:MAG: molecular chaperone DnaJ [Opitutales bacterium]